MNTEIKLCECGCRQPAPVATRTEKRRGYVKGIPTRFIKGHSQKGKTKGPNPALILGDEVILTLESRTGATFQCFINKDNYDRVKPYRWCAQRNRRTFYALTGSSERGNPQIKMHNLLFPNIKKPDHIDGNGLNNTRNNLRPATKSQNGMNCRKQKGASSRFKGVSWHKGNQVWDARIMVQGDPKRLGTFDSERAAARAYDAAARKYFGEFARLNFPQEGKQ